jgi:hypothetical protein
MYIHLNRVYRLIRAQIQKKIVETFNPMGSHLVNALDFRNKAAWPRFELNSECCIHNACHQFFRLFDPPDLLIVCLLKRVFAGLQT